MTPSSLSVFHLIQNASLVVQSMMGLLVLFSVMSWGIIFTKFFLMSRVWGRTRRFEQRFWSGGDLTALYQAVHQEGDAVGLARIFEAGFAEYAKLRQQTGNSIQACVEGAQRAMKASTQRELDALEAQTGFLATVGSVSPYIGLLGTVWGIMNAFRGLAHAGQATLAQVAPGIAEALIATAMGLCAAIPAVMAYNRFIHQIDRLAVRFESFQDEFLNILQRQSAKS